MENKPPRGDILFKNLFETASTFEILSNGFEVIFDNVQRLLRDAMLLRNSGGYMTASFLGTTAREEMAKVHILIDACRLDLTRDHHVLRKLCKAFYNHNAKYAYYMVLSLPKR